MLLYTRCSVKDAPVEMVIFSELHYNFIFYIDGHVRIESIFILQPPSVSSVVCMSHSIQYQLENKTIPVNTEGSKVQQ